MGGEVDRDTADEGPFYGFFLAMKDWKVWWFAMVLTAITVGLSFNAYFRESIVSCFRISPHSFFEI